MTFLTPYCFVLSWQWGIPLQISRCQGSTLLPSLRLCTAISFLTRREKATRPKLNILHVLKVKSTKFDYDVVVQVGCSISAGRIAILEEGCFFVCSFVFRNTLPQNWISASPLEAEQTCAACCRQISLLNFKIELKYHILWRKVECIILYCIQVNC